MTQHADDLSSPEEVHAPTLDAPAHDSAISPAPPRPLRVCVAVSAFPVAGGMRAVITGVQHAMHGAWQIEYLTHATGPGAEAYTIHRFGMRIMGPFNFPNVWMYWVAGGRALRALLRQSPRFDLVLAQDGVFTGAFAVRAGRRAGVPVFCMDHGNVTLLASPVYRAERQRQVQHVPLALRPLAVLRLRLYMASLRTLARYVARRADGFLAAGDEVAEAWERCLGVAAGRVVRFPFMVDCDRFVPAESGARMALRRDMDLPGDAIVISMVNRLAPEKGMDIAIAGLHAALAQVPGALAARIRILIVGDGRLRRAIEHEVRMRGMEVACHFSGELPPADVARVLQTTDIFLYTGIRGINSMAVLEAMAAGCAVVGSVSTRHIAQYLADDRGLAVPVADIAATAAALSRLVCDTSLRHAMGARARAYVIEHHTADAVRRCLLRATGWPPVLTPPTAQTTADAPGGASAAQQAWRREERANDEQ